MCELPRHLADWQARASDLGFQARIRGLTLLRDGASYVLAAPRAFRRVLYSVELELDDDTDQDVNARLRSIRATYQADAIMCAMTLYCGDMRMVRYDVRMTGNQRFRP